MIVRIIVNTAVILLLAVIQTAFVSALDGWLNNLQLIIIYTLLLIAIDKKPLAYIYAFASGLVLGFFSLAPFGLYALSLLFAVFIVDMVFENIITNRSLYSFVMLCAVANVSYKIFLYSSWSIVAWLKFDIAPFVVNPNFWLLEFKSLLLNMIVMLVAYQGLSFISKKYQPRFLLGFNRYG